LSSYLILNEIQTSSVIEKDLFDKFSNILTKEASLTESGKAVKDILKHFAAYKLNLNGGLLDYKSVKNKYDQLTEDNKNSKWGKVIQANLKKLELLGIGQAPPLLIAKKINGDNFNLSSITNKVILLDFWASWCGPCRMENPHYKKLNNKYKNKGLTIIGYSYDTKKDNWKKAIEKDGIDWINISNLKKQKDDVVSKSYQTSALPANIIIMDGKIVARNLFGYELDNFLMKHL
jgi:thiol-disulfide isomerase/thioredoxin